MLEAAALGKPTVCFEKAGGAGEFCARGGGYAVPYLDIEAMGQRLMELVENEDSRSAMGGKAARLVKEEFHLGVVAPKILQLIEPFSRQPRPVPKPPLLPLAKRLRTMGRSIAGLFGSHLNGV
jgi:glycosyltransferase involved in cell wall biosynthesis